jgi:hypothetical protein
MPADAFDVLAEPPRRRIPGELITAERGVNDRGDELDVDPRAEKRIYAEWLARAAAGWHP